MILVTGGAGFIGSNLVASLNAAGRADVVVCDRLGCEKSGATCKSGSWLILSLLRSLGVG